MRRSARDHAFQLGRSSYRDDLDFQVLRLENPEYLISARLPYRGDTGEIQHHHLEAAQTRQQTLCLGARHQIVIAVAHQLDRHDRLGEPVVLVEANASMIFLGARLKNSTPPRKCAKDAEKTDNSIGSAPDSHAPCSPLCQPLTGLLSTSTSVIVNSGDFGHGSLLAVAPNSRFAARSLQERRSSSSKFSSTTRRPAAMASLPR